MLEIQDSNRAQEESIRQYQKHKEIEAAHGKCKTCNKVLLMRYSLYCTERDKYVQPYNLCFRYQADPVLQASDKE